MKRIIVFIVMILMSQIVVSQIVINEIDCDTPGVDSMEFVELKSDTSNFPLDGYVLVFFNGSTNTTTGQGRSYLALDLDGYVTDINGLLLIGSNSVSPLPQYLIPENTIQNGADAVAIYQADDLDFETPTLAYVDETLINVLLYQTNDSDGSELVTIFSDFDSGIQIINEGAAQNTNSIQRNNDGTYFTGTPTPRQLNDGSGVVLNGIAITINQNQYNEGEIFDITFTTEQNVSSTLNFDIVLDFGTFNTSDFTGNTSLTIPSGQNTTSTTITLVDDVFDEGDEVLKISYVSLPSEYLILNSNLQIRVVDNDFTMASFGTPLNPTFGTVTSSQPSGYYNSLDGLSGSTLKQALQDIIANPAVVRAQTYADIIDILKEADQNPANSNQVWLVYLEEGRAKLDFQTTSDNTGKWNREHTFPRSLAGYNDIDNDNIADGKDIFWTTKADSLRHGNSDGHALRAADGPENSIRSNQHYGQYTGPSGNAGSFYGDVARSVLYMEIRYNGLQIVNGFPSIMGQMGDLTTLLNWHRNDPPDDFEMNRNNVVYTWQFNRNPFIDQPDLVEYIWGNMVGEVWNQSLSVKEDNDLKVQIYPNPSHSDVFIKGLKNEALIEVFSMDGKKIKSINNFENNSIKLNLTTGMYFLKIESENKSTIKKIVII
ncbi:endonuclease [Sabulilitoribacter multivorans]|uniref:Endonuclease n=1 Tax=Flaviramulus multivorans TaxID=1304750 RepID=A0ABS9ILM3_9FLAO|nr:endonuclease [Flaviramulus multivorans]MCF7561473.1 endonuclease [Flaviramulus multivorans]